MTNPTTYKHWTIEYVENDVHPGTMTACAAPPDGGKGIATSACHFMAKNAAGEITRETWREDWHADIRAKIDAAEEVRHPSRKMPDMCDPRAILDIAGG